MGLKIDKLIMSSPLMKQVDFYLISNQIVDAKYKLASRLCNKLQRMDQSALIITDNEHSTSELDRVMWSFSDTSFLAHEHLGKPDFDSKIQIGDASLASPKLLENKYNVLINISSEIPIFNHHFERIAEIVDFDEGSKNAARVRYKKYQTEGFEIKTHNIEL